MDPTETLKRLRVLVDRVESGFVLDNATELVELFNALDEWLSNGGFSPDQWRPSGRLIRMD